jgi:UDP-N-acetylmuramoyl-L-alanyl-D-glutamate--2,6-diaminopimelate ligase
MFLAEAAKIIPGINYQGGRDVQIAGISYDSRTVRKGDLFVAIKGEKTDGMRFIEQAIGNGAAAIASEQAVNQELNAVATLVVPDARGFLAEISRMFFNDPTEKIKLAAITGTNGKTTITYLMESIFHHSGIKSCLVGTIGMKIGSINFESKHTTPEASDLMNFFSRAAADGCTHGALEVSSHSLSLKRVFGARFMVGVFTNLTRDHLDFHKDMESYYQAKRILFRAENNNRVEYAVINTDDPYGIRLENETDCPAISFGFNKSAKIHVLEQQSRVDGTGLKIETPVGTISFQMHLIGRPNIYNVMAATGAALCLGINPDGIKKGIERIKGVPGRVQRVDAGQDFTVIVDYAHSPDSLENLLNTVSQLPHEKIITVFGCGGDRDRTKRPIMGEIATRMSDLSVATSDNPRSEDPVAILKEIEPGLRKGPGPYSIVPDRREAIESAVSTARKGDVVVIAGKGHENYQILADRTIPFDDCMLAEELIRQRISGSHK